MKELKRILENPPPKLIKELEEKGEKNYDTIIDYSKWISAILKLIEKKLPKIQGYSPEITKVLEEYRQEALKNFGVTNV